MTDYARLDGGGVTFAIAWTEASAPRLIYVGAALPAETSLGELDAALSRGPRESTADDVIGPSLLPVTGFGWMGEAGLDGVHDGGDGALHWSSCTVVVEAQTIVAHLLDERLALACELRIEMDRTTGVLTFQTSVRNDSSAAFHLTRLMSVCLPLPAQISDILAFEGDWSREQRPTRMPIPPGVWSRINRTGRTGFAGSTLAVLQPGASDDIGTVIAIHLAWSGDHCLQVETLAGGRRQAMAGLHLAPGEVVLAQGETFRSPQAHVAISCSGFNGVSDAYHPFVRQQVLPTPRAGVRKVHFNSWEATYFNFDEAGLTNLAAAAAGVGVERFVLDDGWFAGRRNDASSLGDWTVSNDKFPSGLGPLIACVQALGMDFGLWIEPEMVSPDSDLYRRHPDWCVHAHGAHRPTMRRQLWLDMSRTDVRDHLFACIDALLSQNAIAYLKWDCNRFQFPDASFGRPASERVVRGSLELMDRVRAAHPGVEIEACASGGARADLGVLRRAARVWPSDTTDAIERLRIQRWSSLILPLETIGAHVGPSPNPITGRALAMDLRCRLAMFGHMGVEMDPRRLDELDHRSLVDHIALYKAHRSLIHSGRLLHWSTDDGADVRMVVSQSLHEALLLAVRADVSPYPESAPVRVASLDASARYSVRLVEPYPQVASRRLSNAFGTDGLVLDGAVLAQSGVALPLSDPQTAWLVHLVRV